jgi:hypothetical protein
MAGDRYVVDGSIERYLKEQCAGDQLEVHKVGGPDRTVVQDNTLIILSSGLGFYRHKQLIPMSMWPVSHNLVGPTCMVQITDLDGIGMDAQEQHDIGSSAIYFYVGGALSPTTGYATFIGELA